MKKIIGLNISPLPFYNEKKEQNHNKDYAFGQVFPLITYKNFLLPFQFNVDKGLSEVQEILLFKYGTNDSIDITQSCLDNGFQIRQWGTYNTVKYPGSLPIPEIGQEGLYYLRIMLSDESVYSEVFTITNRVDDYVKLEYSNDYNFQSASTGIIDFSDGFKFRCYLATQIGKPEYTFEEEATERMGFTFIESQVSKKVHKFTFLAPEYLCDALRLVRLCSNKQLTDKYKTYDAMTFSMEPKWEEQGDLAAVECEFETDTILANVGGYQPVLSGGDFNNDYSNDFNIK